MKTKLQLLFASNFSNRTRVIMFVGIIHLFSDEANWLLSSLKRPGFGCYSFENTTKTVSDWILITFFCIKSKKFGFKLLFHIQVVNNDE